MYLNLYFNTAKFLWLIGEQFPLYVYLFIDNHQHEPPLHASSSHESNTEMNKCVPHSQTNQLSNSTQFSDVQTKYVCMPSSIQNMVEWLEDEPLLLALKNKKHTKSKNKQTNKQQKTNKFIFNGF